MLLMLTRRDVMIGGSVLAAATAAPAVVRSRHFVRVTGARFNKDGALYPIAGTNMWYAAYLGAEAPIGNLDRLRRELDRLTALGVDNVRILGSSEFSPLKNSVRPTFRDQTKNYNEALLRGLDHALAEMGRRGMRAVIYLTNFWEWSGGMMTYLYWTNGGRYVDMNDPAHPWPEFADRSSEFYASAPAVAMYHDYIRAVVSRRNTVTGQLYRDDPAIMAWQLANEPRPGGSAELGHAHLAAYLQWIDKTARLIKSLDPNHLVSTGSEGTHGLHRRKPMRGAMPTASPAVDYVTAHIWPQNWSWADPKDLAGTWPTMERNTHDYIAKQVAVAKRLNKPLVIEEFGFPRDGGSFDPATPTTFKDRFYELIYGAVLDSVRSGGPIAGLQLLGLGRRRTGAAPGPSLRPWRHQLPRRPAPRATGVVQRLRHRCFNPGVIRNYASAVKAAA